MLMPVWVVINPLRLARFPIPCEVTQKSLKVPLLPTTWYLPSLNSSLALGLAPPRSGVQPPKRANIFPLLFPLECLDGAGFHLCRTEKEVFKKT